MQYQEYILATRKRFEILPLSRNCLSSSDHDSEKGDGRIDPSSPRPPSPSPGIQPRYSRRGAHDRSLFID